MTLLNKVHKKKALLGLFWNLELVILLVPALKHQRRLIAGVMSFLRPSPCALRPTHWGDKRPYMPKYASFISSDPLITSGVPSALMDPSCITYT
jgi:hypothetical protein